MKTLLLRFAACVTFVVCLTTAMRAQSQNPSGDKSSWLWFQTIPNFTWTTFPSQTNFAFEWRATPVLYSFGMTKLVSPWHFFFVEPPARFTGSIEAMVTGEVFTSKAGTSHFGYSGQLIGHVPLIERGEYLALAVGGASYHIADRQVNFGVLGVTSFFGFLQYTVKYSPDPKVWMNSLDIRVF